MIWSSFGKRRESESQLMFGENFSCSLHRNSNLCRMRFVELHVSSNTAMEQSEWNALLATRDGIVKLYLYIQNIEVKLVVLVFEKESLYYRVLLRVSMKLLLPIGTSYPLLLATYVSLNETCCPGEQSASQKKSRVRLPSNQLNYYQEANTIKSAVKLGLELALVDVALRLSHMYNNI